jgi:hypothetical protein
MFGFIFGVILGLILAIAFELFVIWLLVFKVNKSKDIRK